MCTTCFAEHQHNKRVAPIVNDGEYMHMWIEYIDIP